MWNYWCGFHWGINECELLVRTNTISASSPDATLPRSLQQGQKQHIACYWGRPGWAVKCLCSGGLLGPVTQLRTGTSSSTLAWGCGADIMPFNEMPESTKETKIEMLLLILCQTFLRRRHLQVALRLQKSESEKMYTWLMTFSEYVETVKKNLYSKDGAEQRTDPTVNLRGSSGTSLYWKPP